MREEQLQTSMQNLSIGKSNSQAASVQVPYQKRVDLMMEREREKQERLSAMRKLKEYEEVN